MGGQLDVQSEAPAVVGGRADDGGGAALCVCDGDLTYSSRKIPRRLVEDVAMRFLAAGNQPDNAQAAVDGHAQVIVAQTVTPMATDVGHLMPLVTAITETLRRQPRRVLADAGYCAEDNLQALADHGIDAYVGARPSALHPRSRRPPGGQLRDLHSRGRPPRWPSSRSAGRRSRHNSGGRDRSRISPGTRFGRAGQTRRSQSRPIHA
jgi:Transposase DDE domain